MLNNLLALFEGLNPMDLDTILKALNILWQGLVAIFVVIALIIVSVKLCALAIDKYTTWKKQREEAKNQENDSPHS